MRRRDLLAGSLFAGLVLAVPALASQEGTITARFVLVPVGTTTELELFLTNAGPDAEDVQITDGVAAGEHKLKLDRKPIVAQGQERRTRAGSRSLWIPLPVGVEVSIGRYLLLTDGHRPAAPVNPKEGASLTGSLDLTLRSGARKVPLA